MGQKIQTISDKTLLDFLHTGDLEVDPVTAEVFWRGNLKKPTIVGTEGKNGTRKRIEIHYQGFRRSIVLARLVYMAGTRKVIPRGYEIHHVDFDRYNDSFDNLIALTVQDHLKIHNINTDDTPF